MRSNGNSERRGKEVLDSLSDLTVIKSRTHRTFRGSQSLLPAFPLTRGSSPERRSWVEVEIQPTFCGEQVIAGRSLRGRVQITCVSVLTGTLGGPGGTSGPGHEYGAITDIHEPLPSRSGQVDKPGSISSSVNSPKELLA
ncbi:conserved hypothetical protein [Coccidioides posadasii str. Silveira]|uniref:Uncharacterized protein n=2 Tax=Coccidioides posadasii TaxID=199306 RepID=E9DI63_COCPS|nr:conserved hypothetical protein [Coccidioides posadasii str. Silveira]KMM67900.1 hypothetical protein CPAG_04233 [Coccidioides posadasii RMSCC 3488]